MNTAMAVLDKPLYSKAQAYCDRAGLTSMEQLEHVRVALCCEELQTVMQPWMDMLAKVHPVMYSTDLGAPLPQSYLDLQAQVEEMRAMEMKRLGLHAST